MTLGTRTPLAWKNLTHHRVQLFVAVAAVAFAVMLMFMEQGFLRAALDSPAALIQALDADLVIVSSNRYSLVTQQRFDRQRLALARGCAGVADVGSVYLESSRATLRVPPVRPYPVRVIAFPPEERAFAIDDLIERQHLLLEPFTCLIDRRSKRVYGIPRPVPSQGVAAELSDRSVSVIGEFTLGLDLSADGNVVLSAESYARCFPAADGASDPLDAVDLGLVRVQPGATLGDVHARLIAILPSDVEALTRDELAARESNFWESSIPVGYIFRVGMVMGFIVGVVVCYQVIHSDITRHLKEFATLKAMGYRSRWFLGVVMGESLYLALLGFVPGWLLSLWISRVLSGSTGLAMSFTAERVLGVLTATVVMCLTSGCLVIRKVLAADPADLF